MSFRLKTVIGIILVQACVLILLVWLALYYLNSWSLETLKQRADETSQLFATLAKDAVISTDLASLEEMVKQVSALPEIAYIRISDPRGLLASHGDDAHGGSAVGLETAFTDDALLRKAVAEVREGSFVFGQIQIGYYREGILERLQEAGVWLVMIALAGLLLLTFASWWLGWHLTSRLGILQRHALAVASGQASASLTVHGQDELAVTARAFNSMQEALQSKQRSLHERMNDLRELNERNARSELYLRTVLESASDGIITIDCRGHISRINPAGEQLFGYSQDELVGQNIGVLMPEHDRQHHDQYMSAYLEGGAPRIIGVGREVMGLKQDGSQFPLDLSVSEMNIEGQRHFVGLVRDLTASRELQAEIRRSEKIKSMITDASLDALVTIDIDGIIVEYNRSAELLFGWSREQMLGELMEHYLIPPDLRDAHRQGMDRFRDNGQGPLIGGRVEIEAMCADGTRIPVELSLVATEIDGVRLATAFLRDIRTRKEAEQQLIDAKESAEYASQAKSRFLSHMSHEIRSPLNAVLASVNLIAERVTDSDQKRLLETAQSSGQTLLAVVNEVLDFSRIEAGYLEISNAEQPIEPVINEVLNAAQARLDNSALDLICHVTPEASGQILFDPLRLRQVINILVDNAIKFTHQGIIAVIAERIERSGQSHLKISVRDTGVGIPQAQQLAIFDEFEQVDATRDTGYGGTGLGLTIARRLVVLMGGHITVDSEVGQGSCFHFALPTVFGEFDLPRLQPLDLESVLLVSDNKALRALFATKLTALGIACHDFGSLEEQHRWRQVQAVNTASSRLLIDESALLAEQPDPAWLQPWQGRMAVLGRVQSDRPTARLGAQMLTKPLSCTALFRFLSGELPVVPQLAEQAVSLPDRPRGRVLLVEDVAANRLVAGELLRRRGFAVEEAVDGVDALEKAAAMAFDVILMDVRMPRMNGIDAVLELRSGSGLNARTPVVALTANAEPTEINRCREAGMDAFISKPFDSRRLLDKVDGYCRSVTSAEPTPVSPAKTGVSDSQPLLVDTVLEQLIQDTSVEIIPQMITVFVEELRQRVEPLRLMPRPLDAHALAETAHALKSSAGTFGAARLHLCAGELERIGRQPAAADVLERATGELLEILQLTLMVYQQFVDDNRANRLTSDEGYSKECK